MITWCAAIALSGCAEDEATKVAQDPYLPTMMKDPLYTWRPAGDLSRTEALFPRSTDNFASGTSVSRILITYTFRTPGNPESLLEEAQGIAVNAGYSNGTRLLMQNVNITNILGVTNDRSGIQIILIAPE
jgi:hypothetical protein